MEKISETLFTMLKDRKYHVQCNDFDSNITVVNKDLIIIKIEEPKVGINSVKYIASSLDDYNVNHCIVLYNNSITAFAKNSLQSLLNEGKIIEFFLYEELIYNVTQHSLVPKHILLNYEEKKEILKTYNVTEKKVPHISKTDPVSRYFNAKIGEMFKIVRNSDVTYKSIYYRIVV